MKNLFTLGSFLVALLFIFSSSTNADPKTIVDGILQVPYTSEQITIDGDLDDIWNSVTAHPMVLFEGGPEDSVGVLDDHFTSYRVLWNDDFFYVFVHVIDDELDGSELSEPWNSDAIEIFFDGDNAKAGSYDANDIQWRWVYGQEPGDTVFAYRGPGNFAFKDTESGFNFELGIPVDSLAVIMPLEADHEFGFEISNADRDNGARDEVLHWWTTNGLTWNDPSLFGTAILLEREVTEVIEIQYTEDQPTIDGVMEEGEGWEIADELTMMKIEGDGLADTIYANWQDHLTSFWAMWDENNFYVYVKVIDEELDGSELSEPWNSDAIEIFFDGDNAKAGSYDANDIQWRWVYGQEAGDTVFAYRGPGNFAFNDTELGFDFELAIPKDSLAVIMPLVTDHEFGFEISNADRDNGARDDVRHWWTTNGLTWNDPSLFGTALLVGGDITAVEKTEQLPTEFNLEQNYPNPFNPSTTINYSITAANEVQLVVYDIIGREIAVLVNEHQSAGTYKVTFDAAQLSSGVYFYKLKAGNNIVTKKMILMK